jgi:predicted ATPase
MEPLRPVPELLRFRTGALTAAITEVAAEHPAAVLIDDVHWLDPDSHQVIAGVLHRLDRAPALVVTTGRPGVGRPLEGWAGIRKNVDWSVLDDSTSTSRR